MAAAFDQSNGIGLFGRQLSDIAFSIGGVGWVFEDADYVSRKESAGYRPGETDLFLP